MEADTLTEAEFSRKAKRHFPFLPQSQAEVAYLALVEGLSNEEIGDRLGITYGSASILLHRATKKVKARSQRQALAHLFLLSAMKTGMRGEEYARNLDLVGVA